MKAKKYYKACTNNYIEVQKQTSTRMSLSLYPQQLFTFNEIADYNPSFLIEKGYIQVIEVTPPIYIDHRGKRFESKPFSERIMAPYVKPKERVNHLLENKVKQKKKAIEQINVFRANY